MADAIKARRTDDRTWAIHPAGTYAAVMRDLVDLGEKWEQFDPKKPGRPVHRIVLIFSTEEINPDTQQPFELRREFTATMSDRGHLRPFVENWTGRKFATDDAAWDALEKLHLLEGKGAVVNVTHKTSAATNRTYAVLESASPLMKGMTAPKLPPYQRDPYWETVRERYAQELAEHQPAPTPAASYQEVPARLAQDEDEPLPF